MFCVYTNQQHRFKCFITKSFKCTCQSCYHRHFMFSYVRIAIVSSPATYLIIRNQNHFASVCLAPSRSSAFAGVSITSFNVGIIRSHCCSCALTICVLFGFVSFHLNVIVRLTWLLDSFFSYFLLSGTLSVYIYDFDGFLSPIWCLSFGFVVFCLFLLFWFRFRSTFLVHKMHNCSQWIDCNDPLWLLLLFDLFEEKIK